MPAEDGAVAACAGEVGCSHLAISALLEPGLEASESRQPPGYGGLGVPGPAAVGASQERLRQEPALDFENEANWRMLNLDLETRRVPS